MAFPDDVSDRETFGDAVRCLLARPALSPEELRQVMQEARRRGLVVDVHRRATAYAWAKGRLPQKSEGPYLGFLLDRRVPIAALPAWIAALDRARTCPPTETRRDHGSVARQMPSPDGADAADAGAPCADVPPRDGGRRRWPVGAAVGLVFLTVGLVIAGWPTGSGAAPQLASEFPSTVGEPFLREDFDGTQLSTLLWRPPAEPAHVYAADRSLNLVGATDTDAREIDSDLEPRAPQDFREIDFTVSIRNARVPGAGGGSLVVTEQDGRTHKLVFGPSPGNPPTEVAAALVCSRPSCRSYDDYDPPPPTRPFEFLNGDEVVPFRVVQNDDTLTFLVRGQVMGQTAVNAPLRSFRFNAYSGPEERWLIAVDGLRVYR